MILRKGVYCKVSFRQFFSQCRRSRGVLGVLHFKNSEIVFKISRIFLKSYFFLHLLLFTSLHDTSKICIIFAISDSHFSISTQKVFFKSISYNLPSSIPSTTSSQKYIKIV